MESSKGNSKAEDDGGRPTEWPFRTQADPVEGAAEESVVEQHGGSGRIRGSWFAMRNAMQLKDVAVFRLNVVGLDGVAVLGNQLWL